MKIYYLKDGNCAYSADEQNLLSTLAKNNTLIPIHMKKCTKSRHLCKKGRMKKLKKDLLKLDNDSLVVFFNFMHLGKSYEEISLVLSEMPECLFMYVYPKDQKNLHFCKEEKIIKMGTCKLHNITLDCLDADSKQYIKKEAIRYGFRCSKSKLTGRKKGSTNKASDYDPFKDKIIEGLENNMSIRKICTYIGFGTKSGLEYYIEHHEVNP